MSTKPLLGHTTPSSLPPLAPPASAQPSVLWRLVATGILAGIMSTLLWAMEARAEGDFVPRSPVVDYAALPKTSRSSARVARDVDVTGAVDPSRSTFGDSPRGARIVPRATAPMACVPGELKAVLARVASRFGEVSVESTRRGHTHNRRAGGARKSLHLSCRAVDFRVRGRTRGLYAFIRAQPEVGGFKIYRGGIIHIDNGERRRW